ncbi:MAG: hypothetical protein WD042_05905 [Phycisphaeraceae bacterium]
MAQPLALHPDNPHYFLHNGQVTVLITSAEHYGAVSNLDFDYLAYLEALAADRLNHTRLFIASYVEPPGAFKIQNNSLCPAAGRLIAPWARSTRVGYAGGGAKFDLMRWDPAYFVRLRDFIAKAARHDIIVEVTFFSTMYNDATWQMSPMHPDNNINGVGMGVSFNDVYQAWANAGLRDVQDALAGKVITELKDCDNIYYEIINEPYIGDDKIAWQNRMINSIVVPAQAALDDRHLLSVNVANGDAVVTAGNGLDSNISIYNFHYSNPRAVRDNYGLSRAIGDNETNAHGPLDATYRREAWAFILGGGAIFSNVDWSFTVDHEDGTYVYDAQTPGGGGAALRAQLGVLKEFIHGFDLVKMHPQRTILSNYQSNASAEALIASGKQYALYLKDAEAPQVTKGPVGIDLPAGNYRAQWIDVLTGEVVHSRSIAATGGVRPLKNLTGLSEYAVKIVETALPQSQTLSRHKPRHP